MKTRIILLFLLIVSFSCGTNNKPVSDAQKEKIKGEVKEVVNTLFKSAEEANFDKVIESWYDSPDFLYTYNGNSFGYKEFVNAMKPVFNSLINQKNTIVGGKIAVLDNSTVMYTANTKWLMNFKDGHAILQDPWTVLFMFKKIDAKWRVIYSIESGVEQSVKNTEIPNLLDQVEVSKYFLGTWQCEMAKDTFKVCAYKQLGTGMECNIKIVTKGKTLQEGKLLYGYDKKSDKFIQTMVMTGSDINVIAFWFTSQNTGEGVLLKDFSNPDNAILKFKLEFKSPDLWSTTVIENNKTIATSTYTRIKN